MLWVSSIIDINRIYKNKNTRQGIWQWSQPHALAIGNWHCPSWWWWMWGSLFHTGTGSQDACSILFSLYIWELNPYPRNTPTYHTIPISVCLPPFPCRLPSILIDPYSTCTCRAKLLPHLPKSNPLPFFYLHAHVLSLLLPGSGGVNCSLVVEQQEPRRTTRTPRRDGWRQQQLIGVVSGHRRRATGACSALLTTLPSHGVPLNSFCTCLLRWIDREYYSFFVAINRFTAAPFFWSTTRCHVFLCLNFPLHWSTMFGNSRTRRKIVFFFTAAAVSLRAGAGCNVDHLSLVAGHLKH